MMTAQRLKVSVAVEEEIVLQDLPKDSVFVNCHIVLSSVTKNKKKIEAGHYGAQ